MEVVSKTRRTSSHGSLTIYPDLPLIPIIHGDFEVDRSMISRNGKISRHPMIYLFGCEQCSKPFVFPHGWRFGILSSWILEIRPISSSIISFNNEPWWSTFYDDWLVSCPILSGPIACL